MDEEEIRRSAALEEHHWWYASRRDLVRRASAGLSPGRALDVGCGSGGNSAVLRDLGWQVCGIDASEASTEASRSRGLAVVRGDARSLPFHDEAFDLLISTDAWEHVDDDEVVAAEAFRVLRPGGTLLVAVPAGMDLWSGHDVALGHYRRYERPQLVSLVQRAGFAVDEVCGWNVLLRPVARVRRSRNRGESEMEEVHPLLNRVLKAIVGLEARLPVRRRRGISLVLRGHKP